MSLISAWLQQPNFIHSDSLAVHDDHVAKMTDGQFLRPLYCIVAFSPAVLLMNKKLGQDKKHALRMDKLLEVSKLFTRPDAFYFVTL